MEDGADNGRARLPSRVQPNRDPAGKIIRWFGTNTDITGHQAIANALAEEKRRLETLNRTAEMVARELEVEKIVQRVTDAGVDPEVESLLFEWIEKTGHPSCDRNVVTLGLD